MKERVQIHLNRHAVGLLGRPIGIIGRELESGDVLESTDVYESTGGTWQLCPCPGLTLQAGPEITWVRPGEFE